MKKGILIIIAFFSILTAKAQYLEVGLQAGGMFYSGDLSHTVGSTLRETHPAIGLFVKQNFSDYFALEGHFNYGQISGRDKYAKEEDLVKRDLSFQSTIMEFGAQVEYNFQGYQPYGMYQPFSPYAFLGVGATLFNPKTRYNNAWEYLQPLQTEGVAYKKVAISIPFGFGVKYALNDTWNVGGFFGWRPTLSDYLDDVSGKYLSKSELLAKSGTTAAALGNKVDAVTGIQRGDDRKFDMYHFIGVSISYNFTDNGLIGVRRARRSKSGCKQSLF